MGRFRSWKKKRVYRPELLLQQLEERIVLDASVSPAPQDHTTDHPATTQDQVNTTDTATKTVATDAGAAGGAGGGAADLAAKVPDSYNHVFSGNLNVVLISNNLADVKTISDAAQKDATVITYDAQHDNLATITAKLQDLVSSTGHKIDNLAILGHSSADELDIGTDHIQFFTLSNYQATFETLGQTLSQGAQIQFYGCDVAHDPQGQALVDRIAIYAHADTFASTDATGGATHNWTLEFSSNSAATIQPMLDSAALASDNTVLADISMITDVDTSGSSNPTGFVQMGGKTFFVASDPAHGAEIWVYDPVTDPAHPTTSILADIVAGSTSSSPSNLTVIGNQLFFTAHDDALGYNQELWVSDGTAAGTHMVKDINSAPLSGGIVGSSADFTAFNGHLYFQANDGSHGQELWTSDGTADGTQMVADINSTGSGSGVPFNPNLTVFDNDGAGPNPAKLYFSANDGTNGQELWVTDGIVGGDTHMVKDLTASGSTSPSQFTVVGNHLFFTSSGAPTYLYETDGSAAGTVQVPASGTNFFGIQSLAAMGGKLYFSAYDGTTGDNTLWVSDGSSISEVKSPATGGPTSPGGLTAVGNTLYFSALTGGSNQELWESDGTAAGTQMVKDINPTGDSTPTNLINYNGTLYFSANDGTHGLELWQSNGTALGTTMVTDLNPGSSSGMTFPGTTTPNLVNLGGTLFFPGSNGLSGVEAWMSDGTAGGTHLVQDINLSNSTSGPTSYTNVNGTLYFLDSDGAHGTELWKTDGTAAGTAMVADINPGSASSSISNLMNVNDTLFFTATDVNHGTELYRYTPATSTLTLFDINTTVGASGNIANLINVNNTVYFTANDGTHGTELYKVAPGAATATLFDINTSAAGASSSPASLTNVNGTLFFTASDGTTTGYHGTEVWVTDGIDATVTHTHMIADINTSTTGASSSPQNLTNVNGELFFSATDGTTAGHHATELYRWSPATSTLTLFDINTISSSSSSSPASLTNVNGTLFFTASDGTGTGHHGTELYEVLPGATTATLFDINPATTATASSIANLFSANGSLYFNATDGSHGVELYKIAPGDAAPTLFDIYPGAVGSSTTATSLVNMNGTLFFTANDGTHGTELWETDGTTAQLVKDIYTGSNSSSPGNLTVAGSTLYFTATDSIAGTEIWATDGTTAGTHRATDVAPGNLNYSSPTNLTYLNGTLYFQGNDGVHGTELWGTLGTPTATAMVKDIQPGTNQNSSSPSSLITIGNQLYFIADNGASGKEPWVLTDTAPTATNLIQGPYTIAEDSGPLSLSAIGVTDTDLPGDTITANLVLDVPSAGSFSSGAGGTFNAATGVWTISGTQAAVNAALANLTFTPAPDWNGTVHIRTEVFDNAVQGPTPGLITVNVTPVNDAPVTGDLNLTVAEDNTLVVTGWTFSDAKDQVPGGSSANNPLSVNIVDLPAHGTLYDNGVALTAGAVVPWADATGGKVTFQPEADWNGSTSLHFTVQDDGGTANGGHDTSLVAAANETVTPVNDAPVTSDLTLSVAQDNTLVVTGWTFSDTKDQVPGGSSANNPVSVNIVDLPTHGTLYDNGVALTAGAVVPWADATGGKVTFQPEASWNGSTSFHFTVKDDGGTVNGGQDTSLQATASVTVTQGVNVAPVISLNGTAQQTDASGAVIFDAAHNNLISVSDVDAGTGQVKVTLTATHGTMTLNGVTGLTFDPGQGTGTGDATMTFAGTLANINTALNGMTFSHAAGYYGLADITVTANDQGNTGSGGAQTANAVENLSVEPYNVWFHGFGTEAGYDVYNGSGVSYYTHDYTIFWQQVTTTNTWTFYNGTAWVPTDALGDAPYDGSFGPYATWFHDTSGGTYNGYDVYIGHGVTYFSLDWTAGATYWQVSSAGAWQYYDGSAWYATAGFNVDPVNVWFHGFGTELSYDVYNYTAGGPSNDVSYFTHNYTTFWQFADTSATWSYFNGTAWVPTTGLGVVV